MPVAFAVSTYMRAISEITKNKNPIVNLSVRATHNTFSIAPLRERGGFLQGFLDEWAEN